MYKLTAIGYDAPVFECNYETEEKARKAFSKAIKEYVRQHGQSDYDNEYDLEYDDVITLSYEEKGAVTFRIYEIPDFKNKAEEYLWLAKLELDNANSAADDYKCCLIDCCVDTYTAEAEELINKALKLI